MPLGPPDTVVLDLGLGEQFGLDIDQQLNIEPFQTCDVSFRGFRMNEQPQTDAATCQTLARIEEHVRCRLTGLLRDFHLVVRDKGLVLRGHVHTYYAKQLAQHAVMEATSLPIRANELEVY